MAEDFEKIFAANGDVLALTDEQYLQGFSFLGSAPPTVELFNYLFRSIDQKLLNLFNASNQWKAATAYAVGDIIFTAVAGNSYKCFECTVAGTSGATEPTWPAVGSTVVDGGVTWKAKRLLNNVPYNQQMYTVAGTYTFTAPVDGLYDVLVVGGGGGGGGARWVSGVASSAGGGGGGYARKWVFLAKGEQVTVTVGAKGNRGYDTPVGGFTGGTSSFGTHCSATGGEGGQGVSGTVTGGMTTGLGGKGGKGIGGDICGVGGNGAGADAVCVTGAMGAYGGASILSAGAPGTDNGAGGDGVLGAGGSGADANVASVQYTGGFGGVGVVWIKW